MLGHLCVNADRAGRIIPTNRNHGDLERVYDDSASGSERQTDRRLQLEQFSPDGGAVCRRLRHLLYIGHDEQNRIWQRDALESASRAPEGHRPPVILKHSYARAEFARSHTARDWVSVFGVETYRSGPFTGQLNEHCYNHLRTIALAAHDALIGAN